MKVDNGAREAQAYVVSSFDKKKKGKGPDIWMCLNGIPTNERSNSYNCYRMSPRRHFFFFSKQLDEVQHEIEMDILQLS